MRAASVLVLCVVFQLGLLGCGGSGGGKQDSGVDADATTGVDGAGGDGAGEDAATDDGATDDGATDDGATDDGATDDAAGQDGGDGAVTDGSSALAALGLSDAPSYDFGDIVVGGVAEHTFTVTNSGTGGASNVTGAAFTGDFAFKGGSYPGSGGDCAAALGAGASCSVVVTFAPAAAGAASSKLRVSYFDGENAKAVETALAGNGLAAALLAISDAPSYDFGGVAVGATADHAFTVENTGGADATNIAGVALGAPFGFKGGSYPGSGGTCGDRLDSGSSCVVVVAFAPSAAGAANATLSLSYHDGSANQSADRALGGTGLTSASLAISDGPTFDYGTVATGTSVEHTFTVTNNGPVDATAIVSTALSAPFAFKGGAYPGTDGTCGATLAGAGSCTVVVTFAPTAGGVASDKIDLSYHDGTTTQAAERPISGTGLANAMLVISDDPTYDFGPLPLGGSAEHTFTVDNIGPVDATAIAGGSLSAPFAFKGGSYPGTGGTCSATLAPLASCTVIVAFSPTAAGAASDALSVSYHDGTTTQSTSRSLSGTGVDSALLVLSDAPEYDFGSVIVGNVAEHAITVENVGPVNATAVAGAALAAPFGFKGGSYPGTGGSCGATIAAGTSCTVVVVFTPTGSGTGKKTLGLSYNDGIGARTAERDLVGTGLNPALLTISDGPTYPFGVVVIGADAEHTFTVSNGGNLTATGLSAGSLTAPFAYKGGSYPGTGGDCGASLAAAASCTIVVTFTPTASGAASGTIGLDYNDGAAAQTASRPLNGTGISPGVLVISDGPTYDFGVVVTSGLAEKTFTVSNTGDTDATGIVAGSLAAPFVYKGGSYPGSGGDCGATLAGGNSCTLVVIFIPTTSGVANDTLGLTYDGGLGSQVAQRALTGTGRAAALLAISDGATYDFGSVGLSSTADKTFTVTNSGETTAASIVAGALSAPFGYKGGSYPGTGGDCGTSLAGAASCTLVVTFAPTTHGAANDTLSLTYNDGVGTRTANRALTGGGVDPAVLAISDGPTYDFGSGIVGSSADKTLTVTNSGTATASSILAGGLTAPFAYKGAGYPGTGGDCGTSLAGGSSCTVVVTFAPTSSGAANDTLTLNYDDGLTAQAANRALTGTGIAAALLAISDGPVYDYGALLTGAGADKTLTVTNSGEVDATGMVGGSLTAPFAYLGGSYPGTGGTCGGTLAPSTGCTVVVRYNPTVAGTQTDTLQIAYNDGVGAQNATRGLSGTAQAPALLTISDAPTYDFGWIGVDDIAEHVFTVTNSGGVPASGMAGSTRLATTTINFKGSYPGIGGTCGTTLDAGASCILVMSFSPPNPVLYNDDLWIDYNDGAGAQRATRALTGQGTTLGILVINDYPPEYYTGYGLPPDGSSHDFGVNGVGRVVEHTFAVTNTGGGPATITFAGGLAGPFGFKGGSFPGTGGNCGTVIAADSTCFVVATFAPTAAVASADAIFIAYNSGAFPTTVQRDVIGTGTTEALLAIYDFNDPKLRLGPQYDFGTHGIGSETDHVFAVFNQGAVAATGIAAATLGSGFSYQGGSYPGTGGSCGSSLAAGAACSVVVTFKPSAVGVASGTVQLDYNDGVSAQSETRAIKGTGIDAALLVVKEDEFVPLVFDFGTRGVGSTSEQTFRVLNQGTKSATSITGGGLAAPYAYKGGSYPGTGGNCGATIDPGKFCTIVVTFTPTADSLYYDSVEVTYNDNGAPPTSQTAKRDLVGVGTSGAYLSIRDWEGSGGTDLEPYDFGVTGLVREHTFQVENQGAFGASSISGGGLAAPFAFKGGSYPGSGGSCGATLAVGASCTIVVSYTPSGDASHFDTIELSYYDGFGTPKATREVVGTSTSMALVKVSDCQGCDDGGSNGSIDFGTAGVAIERMIYLKNDGAQKATSMGDGGTLSGDFAYKGGSYPGSGGTCGTDLDSGSFCSLAIVFTPSGSGAKLSTYTVSYHNGSVTTSTSRDLTGTATTLAFLGISDWSGGGGDNWRPYDYGTAGAPVDHTFYVFNMGAQTATALGAGGTLGGDFSYKDGTYPGSGGNCGASLASAGFCTVVVTFNPSGDGYRSSTLTLGYHDGASTRSVVRDLEGIATSKAVLEIIDDNCPDCGPNPQPYDYGTAGLPTDHTFYVRNVGGGSATSVTATGPSGDFAFKGGSYPGTGGDCGATIAVGAKCQIVVTFTPSGDGFKQSLIALDYFDTTSTQSSTRNVQGTASSAAFLQIWDWPPGPGGSPDPNPYFFGITGTVKEHTFYVKNSGVASATSMADGGGLGSGFAYKGGSYPGTGGDCSTSLASGASCSVVVEFSASGDGPSQATLQVSYYDGSATQSAKRDLQATSTTKALLKILECSECGDGHPLDFGTWGVTTTRTVSIYNLGAVAATSIADGATLGGEFAFAGGSYPGAGGDCSTTLAAGASCMIEIAFAPTGTGFRSSTVTITYDDGSGPASATRNVEGTATTRAQLILTESDGPDGCTDQRCGPYGFGDIGVPGSTTRKFTVFNVGGQAVTTLNGGALTSPFGYMGGSYPGTGGDCAGSLAAGSSCQIEVEFAPTAPGSYFDKLGVGYSDAVGPLGTVERSLEGSGS